MIDTLLTTNHMFWKSEDEVRWWENSSLLNGCFFFKRLTLIKAPSQRKHNTQQRTHTTNPRGNNHTRTHTRNKQNQCNPNNPTNTQQEKNRNEKDRKPAATTTRPSRGKSSTKMNRKQQQPQLHHKSSTPTFRPFFSKDIRKRVCRSWSKLNCSRHEAPQPFSDLLNNLILAVVDRGAARNPSNPNIGIANDRDWLVSQNRIRPEQFTRPQNSQMLQDANLNLWFKILISTS